MTSEYDIIEALRTAMAASPDPDPDPDPKAIALEVALSVPVDERVNALATALSRIALDVARTDRNKSIKDAGRPSRWSGKVIDQYKRLLDTQVPLGDGEWKFMRDCTAADLLTAAATRRQHADAVLRQATWYEELAATVEKNGAATVGDLSIEQLRKAA